jgi:aryl-alcohol dehydrogenase-like predicted oxidoreductase
MRTRRFGRLGWQVSAIGHGLWGMGGWMDSDDEASLAALDRSIESGCTFFDTALSYGDGRSEQLLGQALAKHRDRRSGLYVASKIPPKNMKWPASPDDALADVFPPDHIRQATEESLKHLGLESLDLQQFHVWTDEWADDDGWRKGIDDLKREGLIRGFGISVGRSNPANVVRALRTGLVDAVQCVYNVFAQDAEDELFSVCRELDVAVVARVPFDEGSLTGTLTRGQTWPDGDFRNSYFAPDVLDETLDRVALVTGELPAGQPLADAALRFVLARPEVSTVIPGMRQATHVDANLAAADPRPQDPELVDRLRHHRWNR